MATPDRLTPVDFPGAVSRETASGEIMQDRAARGRMAVSLYALIDGAAPYVDPGIEPGIAPGIDAAGESAALLPPILHRAGPIAALIGVVPLSEYCGADAAHHLGDLAWLAPRTMHHAAVLRQAMQVSPVYPAPFATLFASRDSLSAFMLAHAHTLGEFFRSVAGMAEWELKASACLDNRGALEALARDAWPDWALLTPGTRYLRLCRDRPGLVATSRALAQSIAARLAERLQPPATASRRLVLQPAPESDSGELVGRFALLVPLGDASLLAQRVQELSGEAAGDGIALALAGPWPAFSFRPDLPRPPPPAEA
jgi:hypothetical protein